MVSSTLDLIKKEASNFEGVLEASHSFVKWANELVEKDNDYIDNLIQNTLPNVRTRKNKKMDRENLNETNIETTIDLYKFNVFNTAMDTVIFKLDQRFAKHAEICSDFSCLDPRQFSKPLPTTALFKISEVLGLDNTTILRDEYIDFTKKWDTLKLSLSEVYANYSTINTTEGNEFLEPDLDCLQENESDKNQCKTNTRCLNCFFRCFNALFKYRLYVKSYSNFFFCL